MLSPSLKISDSKKASLDAGFFAAFGKEPERYFSAPGRTEIGGNHTDHQRGKVLAAAVDLDTLAAVRENKSKKIRVLSKGYPILEIDLADLSPKESEINLAPALVRGVAAGFKKIGCEVKGFDAYCESTVLPGSGLSSSAAFEVLIGTIINSLFFDKKASEMEIAKIGQFSENVFFKKPCGLMDQSASAFGNLVSIDFFNEENPFVKQIDFDFSSCGYALCIIDTKASHADLTDEYAAIPSEMKNIAGFFGKEVLSEIQEEDFFSELPVLRKNFGDRAVLRAIHFYKENARVEKEAEALEKGDFEAFLKLVKESGYSSYMYLQNVIPAGYKEHQDVGVALALCEHYLNGRGAYRVHGGGFAGTVQAFVPFDILDDFVKGMDGVLGEGACHVLSIRPQGGVEMEVR